MARKTKPWNMKVVYHNRNRLSKEGEPWPKRSSIADAETLGATYVSFDELLAQSDVLSINCPLTPETKQIIDAKAIAKMRKGAYFINTARVGTAHQLS